MTSDEPWPASVEAELRNFAASEISVVVDPDAVIVLPADLGEIRQVSDWRTLRSVYEREGRHRPASTRRLLLHLQDPATKDARDVPWDISNRAHVIQARFPWPRRHVALWRDLDGDGRARLARLLRRDRDPSEAEILDAVFEVSLPTNDPAAEFAAVVRLRLSDAVPAIVWSFVRPLVGGRLASSLAAEPSRLDEVQAAWDDWLQRGIGSPEHALLQQAGPSLAALHAFGLLRGARRAASDLPAWVAIGTAELPAAERVRQLLQQTPTCPSASAGLDDWSQIATWWGAVRASLASAPAPTELSDAAWATWTTLDATFVAWLQTHLGALYTSSRAVPATVDRIAPFLARRMRAGTKKVCLVVMDGMGFTQWVQIRERLALQVHEAHAVVAVAPSLTPFSRQAIFAGTLPEAFEETISDNGRERQRWTCFWVGEGIAERRVGYRRTSGAAKRSVPDLEGVDVVGVAVLAVDDLMHGASLLGDAEMAGSLGAWLDHGFLASLIERAETDDFEVWLTADHGNLEATPIGFLPREGLLVDRHGERARFYASTAIRDSARADGIAWQPPGLPERMSALLFAGGRSAFIKGEDPALVHGGLSFDEMLVPFVRVSR
jgi:hypothetical protein